TYPDTYSNGTSGPALVLGARYITPYKQKYVVGAEMAYIYASTLGSYNFQLPNMPVMQTSGFSMHDFTLRGMFGYDFHKPNGMVLYGWLGYRYQATLVDDYNQLSKNIAKIPSETYGGVVIGAAIDVPRLTSKLGLDFSLDTVVAGSISQTNNLQDGGSP